MVRKSSPGADPRRAAVGRQNVQKRRGLTDAGRERLRAAALAKKPWLKATGPTTAEGKAKVADNGRRRQAGPVSKRELRRRLAPIRAALKALVTMRSGLALGL